MSNKIFKINNRFINKNHPPLVIAEIGINHEGNMRKAKKMIEDAYKSGAECVKFQSHVIEDEMIPKAKSVIPGNAKISIWEIMRKAALTEKQEMELKKLVEKKGMIFLSTPFSRAAANRLHRMKVHAYKIGSGECNNYPLVEHIAKFGKPVILSTGMNDIKSIKKSVDIFKKHKVPYALLHCTSMYPTPYNKVRLDSIKELKKYFPGAILGLSDHSLGNYTCFGATALSVNILEKHFTSNKNWSGPDIPISINPNELKELIIGSRAIYEAMSGKKEILKDEKSVIDFAYASVVTIKNIKKGDKFSEQNIWVKRPGTGEIMAKEYKNIIGKIAKINLSENTQLKYSQIK